jgi:hypothetical protein
MQAAVNLARISLFQNYVKFLFLLTFLLLLIRWMWDHLIWPVSVYFKTMLVSFLVDIPTALDKVEVGPVNLARICIFQN